jgi:hypothetical protein
LQFPLLSRLLVPEYWHGHVVIEQRTQIFGTLEILRRILLQSINGFGELFSVAGFIMT